MVKSLASILLLAILGLRLAAAATAYEALQVVKSQKGDAILKQLIEVRGETGRPQPQSWTILMNDSTARGGIREFVVSGNEILSERTPLRGYSDRAQLPPLDFTRLNLDSDGAFRIANAQATDRKVGFDSVDYTLRTNDATGAPMWILRLFDYMGAPVGSLQVSAENGDVITNLRVDPDARFEQSDEVGITEDADDDGEMGGVIGTVGKTARDVGRTVGNTAKDVGTTVKKTTLGIAGTVQEILTGERTIDRESDSEE